MQKDFREIAHCGGKITITTKTGEKGERLVSLGLRHASVGPSAWFGVYVLPQLGIPVATIENLGLSDNKGPVHTGLFPVLIGSDSEGRFGHQCPRCTEYWRSSGFVASPMTCPYCGARASAHAFVTDRQKVFLHGVSQTVMEAIEAAEVGEKVIDLDVVADKTEGELEKPKFYLAEKAMQTQFTCRECGAWNDVLGRFAYCSACGTRSELQDLEKSVGAIREKINRETGWSDRVRELVGAFDSAASQYVKEMLRRVPLTRERRSRLDGKSLHGLKQRNVDLQLVFGIDLLRGLNPEDVSFANMMFERRHVYEHNGGEADEEYLDKSGDRSVRPKELIRETQENAMRLADVILKLARNLHAGFHELFPPEEYPIKLQQDLRRLRRTTGT